MRFFLISTAVGLAFLTASATVPAQTPEQRKELLDLKKELGGVSGMIRKKEFEEATGLLDSADAKLTEIAESAGVPKTDRKLLGLAPLIERNRNLLETAMARAEGRPANVGVSFSKEVAPIIQDNCIQCHAGANPRGGLNLSTFAGWKQGGQSGRLLIPGAPTRSLLFAKVATPNDQQRMPRGGQALPAEAIRTLGKWIEEGAKYDASKDDLTMADLAKGETDEPSIVIPKPTGNETVSFTKDIAPFMANICLRCHNENRQSGGLSLATFYDMMKGGDSGRVVLPGNVEGSRLFRLTGGLENPRMPADPQVRITRQNYEDLKKWFEEGNTFDGADPRTPIREYVATAGEMEAERFAKMTTEEFNKLRSDRADELWKKALPNDESRFVESGNFLVYGNASAARLEQVDKWAQEHADTLQKIFGGSGQPWRGRLTIFVIKDRFGYDEFNQVNNGRRAPREMVGHYVVTRNYEDAYVCLFDVGDEATQDHGGLRVNLIDQMTGAFLQREGATVPDWVVRGTGLAMAQAGDPKNSWLKDLDAAAVEALGAILNPADIFADGTFSPATIGPVGYTLVRYMIASGGPAKFGAFIKALRSGQSAEQAVRAVYNADLQALGRGYLGSLRR